MDRIIEADNNLNTNDFRHYDGVDNFGTTYNNQPLYLILQKLVKDGYVDKDVNLNYSINYSGIEFLNKGGYDKKLRLDKIEERRKIILDYALIFGSVGAIVAALLSLWEMFRNTCCY